MKTSIEFCPACNRDTQHDSELSTNSAGIQYRPGQCRECGLKRALPLPHELYAMPYGKHKGRKLKDVPRSYLEWFAFTDLPMKVRGRVIEFLRKTGLTS